MTRFPTLEGKEIVALLGKKGFIVVRQKGSHIFLKHTDGRATVVPVHAGENIGPGLFSKILRDVELTKDAFVKEKKQKKKTA